jgi:membrane-associated PAP2 superfamily phosphatase
MELLIRRSVIALFLGLPFFVFAGGGTMIAQPLLSSCERYAADSTQSQNPQQSPQEEYVPKWYSMISNLPDDWIHFSQNTWNTDNIPVVALVTVSTGALLATDNQTWIASHKWYDSSAFVHHASDLIEWVGDGRPQFGLAGAFALYGFVYHDQRALRTGSELVEAILATGGVVQLLKHVTGRQSPFLSTQPGGEWVPFPNQLDYSRHVPAYDAFPSGHLSTALTTLTVVVENYPETAVVLKPVGYTTMVLLGMSMVNDGIHWYSDYPLAAALGYSFGVLVAHPVLKNETSPSEKTNSGLSLSPMLGMRGQGLMLAYAF